MHAPPEPHAPVRPAAGPAPRDHAATNPGAALERSARFWDRIADRYAAQPVADEAAYQRKLAVTRGYLRPDMEVLELGCGTGSTALVHAPHVKHLRAVDVSPRMIEIARGKAKAAGVSNVTFQVSTVEALHVPDGSVDVVLALSLLHLLEDKEGAIARVRRMLKPGGLFVTSTPCLGDSWKYRVLLALIGPIGRWIGRMPSVVQVFTRDALTQAITGAGFAIDHRWQPAPDKAVFIVARKA